MKLPTLKEINESLKESQALMFEIEQRIKWWEDHPEELRFYLLNKLGEEEYLKRMKVQSEKKKRKK